MVARIVVCFLIDVLSSVVVIEVLMSVGIVFVDSAVVKKGIKVVLVKVVT